MRFPILFQVLRHLLLVILCLSSLWFVTPCLGTSGSSDSKEVLCLSGSSHPRLRKQNDNFSARAVAETAQARAYLSPTVFLGTLKSVLVQRDGTVRAWFAVDSPLKMDNSTGPSSDIEVVYFRDSGDWCNLEVNQDNLRLGSQYLVFGVPYKETPWPSLTASALPIPNEKRTLRAVKKVLCKDCAKAPGVAGLQKARVEEGGRVRLNCHLTGNPIPWVEWYKDGTKIISRGRLRVKTKRRTSRLVIRKARPSDRGVYECRAGNVVQQEAVSATATVIVTKKKPTKKPLTTSRPIPTLTSTQSSPWTTEPCHTTDFCLNGGTCIFYKDVREYVCHCAEGYVGLRCDYKDVRVSLGEVKNYNSRGDIP